MQLNNINKEKGFTLVESLVATAIFALLVVGIYQAFGGLSNLVQLSKLKSAAIALAAEQLEIARNLPYSDVGVINSAPPGKIPYQKFETRNGHNFVVTTFVRSIDDPFDGTIGGVPSDLNPADYKLVAVEISCPTCRNYQPLTLTTRVAPKNLETSSGNGALFVQVIDTSGQPVSSANVKVTNISTTSTTIVQDTTNNAGLLQLVDLPPGELVYKVEISKSGYSSARTYAPGENGLAKPVNQNATILAGQLTKLTLIIDKVSSLQIKTVNQYCEPTGPFSFKIQGSKFMDTMGTVLRYDQNKTVPIEGLLNLGDLESDTYNFSPNDINWAIVGSFPLQSVFLAPGLAGEVKLLLAPKNGNGLLVAVKDGSTGLPLSNAAVSLVNFVGESQTLTTSRGFVRDTDWTLGGESTDGNIETNNPAGEIKLKKVLDHYVSSGYLVSRVLDTATASTTFYNIVWQPIDQATSTGNGSVRFQLASSNEPGTTTWDFVGPDGTAGSFYTVSGDNVNARHSNDRYLRYKVYLTTDNDNYTPNISDIAITYGSECLPFGQVFFPNLSAGTFNVSASKSGYQNYSDTISISGEWQILEISLNPQ